MNVAQTVEGLERYPINLRYPRAIRDSLEKLRLLPVVTPSGARIPLGSVAKLSIEAGPDMIKSENARLNGWVFVDTQGRDLGGYVKEAKARVAERSNSRPAIPSVGRANTNISSVRRSACASLCP